MKWSPIRPVAPSLSSTDRRSRSEMGAIQRRSGVRSPRIAETSLIRGSARYEDGRQSVTTRRRGGPGGGRHREESGEGDSFLRGLPRPSVVGVRGLAPTGRRSARGLGRALILGTPARAGAVVLEEREVLGPVDLARGVDVPSDVVPPVAAVPSASRAAVFGITASGQGQGQGQGTEQGDGEGSSHTERK